MHVWVAWCGSINLNLRSQAKFSGMWKNSVLPTCICLALAPSAMSCYAVGTILFWMIFNGKFYFWPVLFCMKPPQVICPLEFACYRSMCPSRKAEVFIYNTFVYPGEIVTAVISTLLYCTIVTSLLRSPNNQQLCFLTWKVEVGAQEFVLKCNCLCLGGRKR